MVPRSVHRLCLSVITHNIQQSGQDPEMESWAAVQDEMYKHDAAMVKDYAEDIDNLLVFVSVF